MMLQTRKRLLVDPKVQGALVYRVITYCLCCVASIALLSLAWGIATGPEQPTFMAYLFNRQLLALCGQFVVAAIIVLPFIVLDTLQLTNRFVGPIYRMHRMLKEAAANGVVTPIRFREGDYWREFADDLNAALARVASQQNPASPLAEQECDSANESLAPEPVNR